MEIVLDVFCIPLSPLSIGGCCDGDVLQQNSLVMIYWLYCETRFLCLSIC